MSRCVDPVEGPVTTSSCIPISPSSSLRENAPTKFHHRNPDLLNMLSASDKTLLLNNKKCILLYISQQNLLLSYYILVVCDTVPLNKIMHSTSWIEEGCKYRRFTKQKTCSHWCKKCKQRAWPFLGSRLPAWGRCWGHRTKQQIWETVHRVQPVRMVSWAGTLSAFEAPSFIQTWSLTNWELRTSTLSTTWWGNWNTQVCSTVVHNKWELNF